LNQEVLALRQEKKFLIKETNELTRKNADLDKVYKDIMEKLKKIPQSIPDFNASSP
jgi:hypothetical protein